jgi:G3E family GTPase
VGEDDRPRSEVLVRQLEQADLVLRAGGDAHATALLDALAARAHAALPLPCESTWLERAASTPPRDVTGELDGALAAPHRPVGRDGVETSRWVRRRPVHPRRLAEAAREGRLTGAVRVHGHLWSATRPSTVLELDLTPVGYEIASVGAWVAALPDQELSAARQGRIDAIWHPYWEDRIADLVVVSVDRPAAELHEVLDTCLLTDEELALGATGWQEMEDPFEGLGDEGDHLAELGARRIR